MKYVERLERGRYRKLRKEVVHKLGFPSVELELEGAICEIRASEEMPRVILENVLLYSRKKRSRAETVFYVFL